MPSLAQMAVRGRKQSTWRYQTPANLSNLSTSPIVFVYCSLTVDWASEPERAKSASFCVSWVIGIASPERGSIRGGSPSPGKLVSGDFYIENTWKVVTDPSVPAVKASKN